MSRSERLLKQQLFECQMQPKTRIVSNHLNTVELAKPTRKKDTTVRLSYAYRFPRHLLDPPSHLHSKQRANVSIVLGIPTFRRRKEFYLRATIYNLLSNMNEAEQNETLIVVHIGDSEEDEVLNMLEKIQASFQKQLDSGLIDIITSSASNYPDLDITERSKQNLDLAQLMAYAHTKGIYYVQLADDIVTRPHFITSMRKFALIQSALANPFEPSWFVLDFSKFGFLGKLFKSTELPYLIMFLQFFYNDMNAQDVLSYLIESKLCRQDIMEGRHCQRLKAKLWQHFDGNLFYNVANMSLKSKLKLQADEIA
ncbi:hypothetical protein KR093_007865 [Drosophila rubida]|uniref:MGAT4 conserved region domain-containing protein n=1 Tax=Drosophila rubida TaxID=30044 RepID=A0AAD4PLS8_9MUSC|nr:hypothetical protein KR093_007865 [Drosophila rubida]